MPGRLVLVVVVVLRRRGVVLGVVGRAIGTVAAVELTRLRVRRVGHSVSTRIARVVVSVVVSGVGSRIGSRVPGRIGGGVGGSLWISRRVGYRVCSSLRCGVSRRLSRQRETSELAVLVNTR